MWKFLEKRRTNKRVKKILKNCVSEPTLLTDENITVKRVGCRNFYDSNWEVTIVTGTGVITAEIVRCDSEKAKNLIDEIKKRNITTIEKILLLDERIDIYYD